uniref:Uncharacterized protein n=1 Tax=Equus asinus TaxID=9793 RepID=A0A9L0IM69_EQUAS
MCLPFGLRGAWRVRQTPPRTPTANTGEGRAGCGPILALRQHPRKAGPDGGGTWSPSPNWRLDFPADVQPLPLRLRP